jgi:hypothetical protein
VVRQTLRIALWLAIGLWLPVVGAWANGWADNLFAEPAHDFGTVVRGAKVRHSFVLTNRLNEDITIAGVRASCGCTTAQATLATVAPGQKATIDAEMDTRNFVGEKRTALDVQVATASGHQAEIRLVVSATILGEVVLHPGSIDFGTVERGRSHQRTLKIERVANPNWTVERMITACRSIDAELVESEGAIGRGQFTLTATLKPDAPAGVLRDEIRLLTNDPQTRSIPIPVTAQVRGELSISPNVLSLGPVVSNGTSGYVWIRAKRPFAVTAAEGTGEGFSISPDDQVPKPLHRLSVNYHPEEGTIRGDLRRTFRIHTDLPGEPPVDMTVVLRLDP